MSDLDIIATTDGPYHVRGGVTLRRKDGSVIAEVADETWLCRCGQSAGKPFCDGSHERCGFTNEPADRWSGTSAEGAGRPAITVRRNGPYFVEGQAVVRSQDGAVLAEGSRIVLCRCGSSSGTPFCDATHRAIGFAAD